MDTVWSRIGEHGIIPFMTAQYKEISFDFFEIKHKIPSKATETQIKEICSKPIDIALTLDSICDSTDINERTWSTGADFEIRLMDLTYDKQLKCYIGKLSKLRLTTFPTKVDVVVTRRKLL